MSDENLYAPPEAELEVADPEGLASLWMRLAGALIDGLISLAIIFPLMYLLGYWDRAMEGTQSLGDAVELGLLGIFTFLALHGYLLARYGQTIGKRLVKTRIVSVRDDRILPFWRVISLRYVPIWLVSQIPLLGGVLTLVDVLFIFRSDRRCVHDLIAGTKVVNAGAS